MMSYWLIENDDHPEQPYFPGCEYGIFHRADRGSSNYCPGVLVVFIHGIWSDCRAAWLVTQTGVSLAECIIEPRGAVDVDVFSYQFPSKFLHRSSTQSAAERLRSALERGFEDPYRHIYFVVHSSGGLVAKKLLLGDLCGRLSAIESGGVDPGGVSARTRAVINIAVPHGGGQRGWTEVGRRLVMAIELCLSPVTALVRKASNGTYDLGRNGILLELGQRAKLIELENQYRLAVQACDTNAMARPISFEILAESDVAASPYAGRTVSVEADTNATRERSVLVYRDDRQETEPLVLRGTHSTVKVPKRCRDLAVSVMVKLLGRQTWIERYRDEADQVITRETVRRIVEFERDRGVEEMLGQSQALGYLDEHSAPEPSIRCLRSGGQGPVLAELRRWLRDETRRPRRIVLTGSAGVGKSAALRRLARELAEEFVGADSLDGPPLPVFYPIGRMDFSAGQLADIQAIAENTDPRQAVEALFDPWNEWVNRRLRRPAGAEPGADETLLLSRTWWEHRFRHRQTILILDGIDDFLRRYRGVSVLQIRRLVRKIEQFGLESGIIQVLGIRVQPNLASLASSAEDVLAIRRLSAKEAERIIGEIRGTMGDAEAPALLFTPLILKRLKPGLDFRNPRLRRQSGLIEAAVEGVLDWNSVSDVETWMNALTLTAWAFFRDFAGEMTVSLLQKRAREIRDSWNRHLAHKPGQPCPPTLLDGFLLACHAQAIAELVEKSSVLYWTIRPEDRAVDPQATLAFEHEEWKDFFIARYLSLCIRCGLNSELQHRAFTAAHFRLAGELLADFRIDATLVDQIATWSHPFVLGNFVALVGNSSGTITAPAVRSLLQAADKLCAAAGMSGEASLLDMSRLARHVTLTTLSWRALLAAPHDRCVTDIRAELLGVLPNYVRPGGECQIERVTASMAWCYAQALGLDTGAWPGLTTRDAVEVIGWVCDPNRPNEEPSDHHRSLQLSYLHRQESILENEWAVITALHYLFLLAVASSRNCQVPEVREALPGILNPGSPWQQVYADCNLAKECPSTLGDVISKILRLCKELAGPATPRQAEPLVGHRVPEEHRPDRGPDADCRGEPATTGRVRLRAQHERHPDEHAEQLP